MVFYESNFSTLGHDQRKPQKYYNPRLPKQVRDDFGGCADGKRWIPI